MAESAMLDKAYHNVIEHFVQTGRAPHYTELASELGISSDEGRRVLHDLIDLGLPGIWLHPETDLIASFAPFNDLPTQYRISVDGEQKWFAQCGLESLATSFLFPGKAVHIETTCLDCGEPIVIDMRDGRLIDVQPAGSVAYTARGLLESTGSWAYK